MENLDALIYNILRLAWHLIIICATKIKAIKFRNEHLCNKINYNKYVSLAIFIQHITFDQAATQILKYFRKRVQYYDLP